jgi:prophage DNA circulation protein
MKLPPITRSPNAPPTRLHYAKDTVAAGTYEKDLVECKWRDISFPIQSISTQMDQDLVQHKYPDRNGAHIESTGRNPVVISAKAVFYKNTSRGKGETWVYGTLFPDVFLKFVDACNDRSVGKLQHPIHGIFDAKCAHISYDLTGERRDGVVVDVQWLETIKNESDPAKASTVNAAGDAKSLDDSLSDVDTTKIDNTFSKPKVSFLDLVDSVKAFIDTTSLIGQKLLAQIDHVIYHVNALLDSARRANSVLLSNVINKAEALKASLRALRASASTTAAVLLGNANYSVPADTTMGNLVQLLNNDVVTLIKLNPVVAGKPIIPKGTIIRYHPGAK